MAKDAVLLEAVETARDAAVETAGDEALVGDHLRAVVEEDRLVTHLFACTMPGYRGWVWSVTVARAPRQKAASVCEAHLVPADDALLAPAWVPWADRVRPGDLEPSMVLPYIPDDARLVQGFESAGDEDEDRLANWELGLGRPRVLGPDGRADVADRWYRGSHGPTAASAIASTSPCSTCAFFIPLAGSMRMRFGACSNEWSPDDGRVVSVDHGCGAHSETDVERGATQWPAVDPVFENDVAVEMDLTAEPEPEAEADEAPEVEAAAENVEPEAEAEAKAEAAPADEVAETPAEDVAEPVAEEVAVEEAPAEEVVDDAPADEAPAETAMDEAPTEADPAAEERQAD
ncbi:DUF3027 domain-containing protein [Demequina sp. SYSU T00192]|uniref:DUF3027 domain-containing protein n=1 Tax=Demequina litoralis TaxID=3051660 RepID=A0ABT8G8N3_9MICO|nr:DUF3027 domain-containing protein [Demequina sp. SYSU T00192]MDN4475499.1 DUF3027 domain-containing protein [Demequina sp. SYSU T00192]